MSEGENKNNIPQNKISSGNPEFNKLLEILNETFIVDEDSLSLLRKSDTPYDMNFHSITANEILNDLEARKFNIPDEKEKDLEFSDKNLIEKVKTSITDISNKRKKNPQRSSFININNISSTKQNLKDKNQAENFNHTENINHEENDEDNSKSRILFPNENFKKISFDIISSFNETNNNIPEKRNESEIKLSFYEEYKTEEYEFYSRNDNIILEEFKEYFFEVKNSLMDNLQENKEQDIPNKDIDKFILMVLFENSVDKPSFRDMGFYDPLNNFKRFTIRDEDFSMLKEYYFFNGQIIMIEGEADNSNIITLKQIRYGFDLDNYTIEKNYVKQFFKEVKISILFKLVLCVLYLYDDRTFL